MQNWPKDRKAGEMFSEATAQMNWVKWKERLADYKNGEPFEIELRNENDIEICDLVHATMAIMPDEYF